MAAAHPPDVVALDVIETCFALEPLRARLVEVGQPEHLLETWFTRTLRDGFVFAASGGFRPFRDVAVAALRTVSRGTVDEAGAAHVLGGFASLPVHTDVGPAVRAWRDAGVRVMAVTNGGPDVTRALFENAGLLADLERVLSIDEVGAWKPSPAVYRAAAEAAGVAPERVALVAAHAWDCHAARRAGLATGWVSRLEGAWPEIFDRADVEGPDLLHVADTLLGR